MVVPDPKTTRRIVVLGAGYAGLTAAQTLGKTASGADPDGLYLTARPACSGNTCRRRTAWI
jgi:glycine/D-amino acid oxidase-like deaminating enzyme